MHTIISCTPCTWEGFCAKNIDDNHKCALK